LSIFEDVSEHRYGKTARHFKVPSSYIDELFRLKEVALPDEYIADRHSKAEDDVLWPNQAVSLVANDDNKSALALVTPDGTGLTPCRTKIGYYGIEPRNREQTMLFNLMDDPEVRVIVVTGAAGTGKAQPLTSKVLTPSGWRLMGELKIGDLVSTPDGKTAPVTGIFPQGKKEIFRVTFTDGSQTECCDDHLWYTQTKLDRDKKREGSVKSLNEIRKSLRAKNGSRNHYVPLVEDLSFDSSDLLIAPYTLGALLGDGSFSSGISFTSKDSQIVERLASELAPLECTVSNVAKYQYNIYGGGPGYRPSNSYLGRDTEGNVVEKFDRLNDALSAGYSKQVCRASKTKVPYQGLVWERIEDTDFSKHPLKQALFELNLWGRTSSDKFIPDCYLYQTRENRLELLRGLMDTDGTVSKDGKNITFTSVSKNLAEGVQFLVQSLGGTASCSERHTAYSNSQGESCQGKLSYRLTLCLPSDINPFFVSRKKNRVVPHTKYHPRRAIDKVECLGKEDAQCIMIDHPAHLYVTDDMIVTHNTTAIGAYALDQVMGGREDSHEKLILSKPLEIVTKTRYWGTVPGDENDKFGPFLKSFSIMFENMIGRNGTQYIRAAIERKQIEFLPLELMRGATLRNAIVWYDEAQNLNQHECATLGTRIDDVGHSKLVLSGDLNQRDRNLKRVHTGLHKLTSDVHFLRSPLTAHIDLKVIERGEIAELFHNVFESDLDSRE